MDHGGFVQGSRTAKQQLFDACGFPSTDRFIATLPDDALQYFDSATAALKAPVSDDEFDDLLAALEDKRFAHLMRDSAGRVSRIFPAEAAVTRSLVDLMIAIHSF